MRAFQKVKHPTPPPTVESAILVILMIQRVQEFVASYTYLWLALQGPALSLARLRYICSLEPVHVAIVLISIIFMLPMQYASRSKSCAATHMEQPQNNTYMERNRVRGWRVGVSFACLLHNNWCGCVCVASKESTSFLDTIIYSLKDMGTTTSLICCHQKPLITPFLNIILTHCCG